ncbi:MAG: ATP-binding protein [Gammaproteobacteria bacterium]|nr:ATP-binding protein [Gammaproteobacteria bacterium]MCF6363139.1 ATP-binding protein [Gammaproteobacteria bacterium]
MINWIRKSFYRQVMALLIVGGFSVTTVYGLFDYQKERRQLQHILEADARHLADTLSLVIADDIFYGKHFELWKRLDAVYQSHRAENNTGLLYYIREISVTDNEGRVTGHTHPRDHPLLQPDHRPVFDDKDLINSKQRIIWHQQPEPMLLVRYPIYFSDKKVGDITLDLDPQPMLAMQHQLIMTYLLYELMFMGILLVSARFLARWLARPLEQASHVLPQLGTGNVRLPELQSRHDELKLLATAIEEADQRIHAARLTAQDRQNELEERVDERTREIESFTYSVSHDLRSPLRAMDGFAQVLLEDCTDTLDDDGKAHLQRIRGAAVHMGHIIDDLLMLSQLNQEHLVFSDVDLSTIANHIIDELREQSPQRKVEVHIASDMRTRGDARLLRIVLTNLFGNAWKYTSKTTHPRIEFDGHLQDGKWIYQVRDNGTGFDMKYVNKLFGAFQRLHGRDEHEGTGIGLAIVQRIIKRHQGEVWAEAEPGRGATFYFYLRNSDNAATAT